MIMDDEEAVRDVVMDMLANSGYEALQARNGEEAIEIYREYYNSGKPVDIVIMDLTIPGGMGGREAVQTILKIDPDATVIVASGYSDDPVMANYREYGFKAAIKKPFDLRKFSHIIESVG